jgi:hypothetical protein
LAVTNISAVEGFQALEPIREDPFGLVYHTWQNIIDPLKSISSNLPILVLA